MATAALQGNKFLQFQSHLGDAFSVSVEELGDRFACRPSDPSRLGLLGMVGEVAATTVLLNKVLRLRPRRGGAYSGVAKKPVRSSCTGVALRLLGKADVMVQGLWYVDCGSDALLRRGWTEAAGLEPQWHGDDPQPMRYNGESLAGRGREIHRLSKQFCDGASLAHGLLVSQFVFLLVLRLWRR
jgi:hypothetical protein